MDIKNADYIIRSFFIFIRIKDWLHILGLTILGIVFYSSSSLFTYGSLSALIVSSLYLAHGFSLNNYFDIGIDQFLGKKFIPANQRSHKKLLTLSYMLFLINCLISAKISLLVLYLVALGLIIGLIYSAWPFRLKRLTFSNILLNSLGFSIIFLIGFASVSKTITLPAIMMTVLFALVFIPLQIIHHISHSEADKKGNIQTIYNRYDFKITIFFFDFSLLILTLWSLLIGILKNKYIFIFYLTFLFCFLLFHFMQRMKKSKKSLDESALETRLLFRKICLAYGIILFFILYFS